MGHVVPTIDTDDGIALIVQIELITPDSYIPSITGSSPTSPKQIDFLFKATVTFPSAGSFILTCW